MRIKYEYLIGARIEMLYMNKYKYFTEINDRKD